MSNAYDTSARVLDAAAAGRTVPGHEAVGRLLVEVGRTEAVPVGMAIRSSAVAAATAAGPGGSGGMIATVLRPTRWLLVAAGIGVGSVLVSLGPETTRTDPSADLVERIVAVADSPTSVPSDLTTTTAAAGAQLPSEPATPSMTVDEATSGGGAAPGSTAAVPEEPVSTSAPTSAAPTVAPSTSTVTPPTSTGTPASTTSVVPTSTSVPTPTTTTWGNNGNGGGNGVGNGKGNQGGNGNGNGNSGNGGNGGGGTPDG